MGTLTERNWENGKHQSKTQRKSTRIVHLRKTLGTITTHTYWGWGNKTNFCWRSFWKPTIVEVRISPRTWGGEKKKKKFNTNPWKHEVGQDILGPVRTLHWRRRGGVCGIGLRLQIFNLTLGGDSEWDFHGELLITELYAFRVYFSVFNGGPKVI